MDVNAQDDVTDFGNLQIFKFLDSSKTQKCEYLENEISFVL